MDAEREPTPAAEDEQVTLDQLLNEARQGLHRLDPADAARAAAAGALLVDTRPVEQRARDGEVPGAVVIDRNVLEWRLAPSSDARITEAAETGRQVIVLCNQGYSSSLAAATLRRLGVDATDVVGGFEAWRAAGLPVERA